MQGIPSVGIVVPCYNYGSYLRDCVESVLAQSGVDVQVLIIDDASTDDSAAVAAALAAQDRRVECRIHSVNAGHIDTYNEGLQWVTAPYTVVLSADDLLTPGALQRACALLEADPRVGFVYGHCLVFHEKGLPPAPRGGRARWNLWSGHEWFAIRCTMAENCIYSSEVVARSSLFRRLGGYRAELPHAADFEMWMRLALYADVGYIRGPDQVSYRDHAAGIHRQRFGTVLADLTQVGKAFEVLFQDHGHMVADRAHLETCARRMLARRALAAACRIYDRGQAEAGVATALEELARVTYDRADTLSEMRALQRRRRCGPHLCRILQPFTLMTAQRLYRGLRRRRLAREGLCLQRARA